MRIFSVFVFVFFAFSTTLPAHAVSKKELEAHIAQLEQRLSTLENRMLTGDPAAERLMQRMDALEASQRSLTGEVERLRYERDNLAEEVKALAGRVAELETLGEDMRRHLRAVDEVAKQKEQLQSYGGTPNGAIYQNGSVLPGPPTIVGSETATDISKLAERGQEKMREGNFSEAQNDFEQYLQFNPDAKDKADVYFWLGEAYYARSGFGKAAENYIASMRAAPKGKYAPEAMVKLAATARALGKKDMACKTLNSFAGQYPKADKSVRAKVKLEKQRSGC